jgi:hypothetical protein
MEVISMRSMFEQQFSKEQLEPIPDTIDVDGKGTPMFESDSVAQTPYMLDQMLRGIFVKHNITKENFNRKYRDYALRTLGLHGTHVNTSKGNLLKAIHNGNISIRTFRKAMMAIGLEVRDLSVHVTDTAGTSLTYMLSDLQNQKLPSISMPEDTSEE